MKAIVKLPVLCQSKALARKTEVELVNDVGDRINSQNEFTVTKCYEHF